MSTPAAANSSPQRDLSGRRTNDGVKALDSGDLSEALAALGDAAAIDPTYYLPRFNLGLTLKALRRWDDALDAFLAAWSRFPADGPVSVYASILWNVGIMATIAAKWPYAWRAWGALGYPVGWFFDYPPTIPLGPTWVQRAGHSPVLARRLDPARAEIVAVSADDDVLLPGTIVANDGSRIASKDHLGAELAVLPVLVILSTPAAK